MQIALQDWTGAVDLIKEQPMKSVETLAFGLTTQRCPVVRCRKKRESYRPAKILFVKKINAASTLDANDQEVPVGNCSPYTVSSLLFLTHLSRFKTTFRPNVNERVRLASACGSHTLSLEKLNSGVPVINCRATLLFTSNSVPAWRSGVKGTDEALRK